MHIDAGKGNAFTGGLRHWAWARLLGVALAGALLAGSTLAATPVLVFDRGLPTANLNKAAGANRSNILWSDVETLPETPWLPGDDFKLLGTGTYTVTTIRIWSTNSTGLTLRGGAAGGPISLISSVYTATAVTYANSQGYEQSAGGFLQLYQIDFSVNIPLNGGITYRFFLNGPATPFGTDFAGALLHSSTAALSGSTQQGADDTFLFLDNTGTVLTWNSGTGGGTYCPGCVGSSQNTDGNVQVFAVPPPEVAVPTASGPGLAALGLLLAGAGVVVMRSRRRA